MVLPSNICSWRPQPLKEAASTAISSLELPWKYKRQVVGGFDIKSVPRGWRRNSSRLSTVNVFLHVEGESIKTKKIWLNAIYRLLLRTLTAGEIYNLNFSKSVRNISDIFIRQISGLQKWDVIDFKKKLVNSIFAVEA
jgi:hypothetical protein